MVLYCFIKIEIEVVNIPHGVVICVNYYVSKCVGYCLNKKCNSACLKALQCNVRKCEKLPDFFVYHFLSNFNKGLKPKSLLQLNIREVKGITEY